MVSASRLVVCWRMILYLPAPQLTEHLPEFGEEAFLQVLADGELETVEELPGRIEQRQVGGGRAIADAHGRGAPPAR